MSQEASCSIQSMFGLKYYDIFEEGWKVQQPRIKIIKKNKQKKHTQKKVLQFIKSLRQYLWRIVQYI